MMPHATATADYDITVRIRVRTTEPAGSLDNPHDIAQRYADMAIKYTSIGANEATVVEVKKIEDNTA